MNHIDHLIGKEVRVMDHPEVHVNLRGVVGTLLDRCTHGHHLTFLSRALEREGMLWYHIDVHNPPPPHGSGTIYREDVIVQVDNKGNDLEDWLE